MLIMIKFLSNTCLPWQMFYTTPLKAKVETENDRDPVDFINEVLTHTQAHFCLFDSLGTRIKVEVFYPGLSLRLQIH